MNQVRLIGNVGGDLNVISVGENKKGSFSLATNENYTNKNNEAVKTTQWHNIVIWGKALEACESLISKGKFLSIEGKIQNRSYKKGNEEMAYITEIVALRVTEAVKQNQN
jgi:single-strand DNA-binding protein